MSNRTVRVDDDLWARAQREADRCGESLGPVIRAALEHYAFRRVFPLGPCVTCGATAEFVVSTGHVPACEEHLTALSSDFTERLGYASSRPVRPFEIASGGTTGE